MSVSRVHKAIACGAGVILIGVLEVLESSTDLEVWLEQLVPAPLAPLVPVLIGGVLAIGGVYRATNAPEPSADSPTLRGPAGEVVTPSEAPNPLPSPAGASSVAPAAYWAGIVAREPVASTSIVELPPAPKAPSFQ